ncbi:MAG: methylenetetrahydrofolate reductase C-terminal domain-containing protein [Candidatus Bathyarchaeota archaeon]|nr:MAG: methylenetetrahydrofolate reductase C-terminal domain-containing protein [Candidatus Bathyarchaeota archaeon]
MIIVQQKPLKEIFEMTKNLKKLLIVGCDGCSSVIQVGGERQANILKSLLEINRKVKGEKDPSAKAISILRQCDRQIVTTALDPIIKDYDAIVSLSCGVGVQTIADLFQSTLIIPAIDTKFLGMHDTKADKFHEMCTACGECILFETGGVCPLTRCAKSLLNGPCGGQANGRCEVGGWKNDCAWILIFNRLKERNRLDLFTKFRLPKDYRVSRHPRELSFKAENEEATEA